jgi:WD40 repeat protein
VLKRILPQESVNGNRLSVISGEDRLPITDHRLPITGQLLLVIDQFEELFTLVTAEADRVHFINLLLAALAEPYSRLWLVLTLRADFYDRPLQYVELGELLRQRTEVVLPLTPAELEQAITRPAASVGVACEPALLTAITAEVNEQPGALPLVQYALTELFERRNGRTLTLAAYQASGGVTGALARRADEIYDSLSATGQAATRQLFLRLITLGEGVEDTRRRVRTSELEALHNSSFIIHNFNLFGRYRLLTFDRDPLTREPTVEVAHEALLREWPRLHNWLAVSRNDVRLQRRLAAVAADWVRANQDAGYLLRGGQLDLFAGWADDTDLALTQTEHAFLEASISERERRMTDEQTRQQRELETVQQLAQEQTRRAEEQAHAAHSLRQRAAFLTGALVVAAILAVAAFGFARSSTNNANLAITREAEALINLDLAATNEAEAIANANIAAIREAEAAAERATAVAAQQRAEEEANSRATAEAVAIENQDLAEQQQAIAIEQLRLATSRELALAANANLETNPERSLLLGLAALDNAYTTEAEEVVRSALQKSRVELTLAQDGEDIWWIDYHPDGDWLAGVGDEGITIWDTNSGDKLRTVPLVITTTNGLEISPDGLLLAVTSLNTILIVDTNSGEVIHTLNGYTATVTTIAFNPSSTLLASGSEDGELKIWDLISGDEQFAVLTSDEDTVKDVVFSHDGSRIATGGTDSTARIWDVNTGDELLRIGHYASWINNIAFNADDTRLFTVPAVSGNGSQVAVWNIEANDEGEPIAEWFDMHDGLISDLKLSPDGRFLATISQDGTAKLWDATSDTAVEILTLTGHLSLVEDVTFSPDSLKIATLSGGEVRIWDATAAGPGEVLNIADSSDPIAYSSDGDLLITISRSRSRANDSIIKIWDTVTGELKETLDTLVPNVKSYAASPDGRYLAVGGDDNVVKIWDLSTQQEVFTMTEHGPGIVGAVHSGILGLDFSPDGTLLATGGADGYVMVWNVGTGGKVYEWRADPRKSYFWEGDEELANGVTNLQFSPDGRFLAASTDEAEEAKGNFWALIKIWDMASGEEVTVIEDIPRRIWGLAFSPDSNRIAGTGGSGIIKIWDVVSGDEVANLEGATTNVSNVLFSADGRQLITVLDNIVIYDLETEEAILQLPQALDYPILSPDGHHLVVAGDKRVLIYTLDFEELLAIARSRVTRDLTEAECKEYLHLASCPVQE